MPGTASFDELQGEADSLVLETFAERSANGEFEPILYRVTEDAQPLEWTAIVSRIEYQDDVNSRGELRRIESRTVVVRRSQMEADGVTQFQKKATVQIGETLWALRELDTRFGDTLVTLGLTRIPLIEMGAQRGSV